MKLKILYIIAASAVLLSGCRAISNDKQPQAPAGDPAITDLPQAVQEPESSQPTVQTHDTEASEESSQTTSESEPVATEASSDEAAVSLSEASGDVPETQAPAEPEPVSETEASEEASLPETEDDPAPTDESEAEKIDSGYIYQTEDDFFYVVNKQYFLPDDYTIETDYVQGSYELEKTAAKYCKKMIAAAKEDGIDLKVLSAYRTVNYQKKLFERNVKSRMENDGMTYEEAYYDTSINIAPPGGSEHNAGLAVDIITKKDWDTYEAFDQTKEYQWLQEHCWEYGFIMRYLKGKEDITGYIYEPWHYRYVGVKYAKDVMDSGLCLEEYFEQYVWIDGNEPGFPWD